MPEGFQMKMTAAPEPAISLKGLNYWQMSPCLLVIFIDALGFGLIYPLIPTLFSTKVNFFGLHSPMLQHLGISLALILYPLGMFFGSSFMGDLSDRWGRKTVMSLCLRGLVLGFLVMGWGAISGSALLFLIGRAFSGFMAGSQPVAQAALATSGAPENKAQRFALITVVLSLGMIAGGLVGGLFAQLLHPVLSFAVAAGLAAGAVFFVEREFVEPFLSAESTPAAPIKMDWRRPLIVFAQAFQNRSLRFFMISFFLMQLGFSFYFQYLPLVFAHNFKYGPGLIGIFNAFVLGLFIVSLFSRITPWMKERFTLDGALVLSLMLLAVGQVATAMMAYGGGGGTMIWILAIPVGIFDFVAYSLMLTLFSEEASKEMQGWALGVSGSVMAMAWAVSGLFANFIRYDAHALICLGGLLIFAGAITLAVGVIKRMMFPAETV